MSTAPAVGVVLAGGLSSRMGRDKAELRWQGQTLLDGAIALLQASGVAEVRVSGRAHLLGVPDLLPHCGPPGAVLSVLAWLEARQQLADQPLLFIPVDMPLLQPATLQQLLASVVPGRGAHFRGEVFPCVLPASAALLDHLRALFDDTHMLGGRRSMRGLLQFCGAIDVAADSIAPTEFSNVNTPDEWQGLQRGDA